MDPLDRRDVLAGVGVLLSGSVAGCTSPIRGDEPPSTIPVYGRNLRQVQVKLRHWITTTATGSSERSDATWIDPEGETQLAEVPVGVIGITANILWFDDRRVENQRNVLLKIDPDSKAFSAEGYVITVLSGHAEHAGDPDEPVVQESVPADEAVAADFIRIAPRSSGGRS